MALRGTFHFLKIGSAPSIGKSGIKSIKKEKRHFVEEYQKV
jgi:hypothetical protein